MLAAPQTASVQVDPARVENRVSPRMYAAFMEMMAEDVKWGLTAEMLHDRSFEEPANYLGLPARWHLEPDERNDQANSIAVALNLGRFAYRPNVHCSLLAAAHPTERNTFAQPDSIQPVAKTVHCSGVCTVGLPADSVAVVTFVKY